LVVGVAVLVIHQGAELAVLAVLVAIERFLA
jgi:hypothetical protein